VVVGYTLFDATECDGRRVSRLFSVRFEESEDYVSFFNRLFASLRQVKPLLHELTKIEALSVYYDDESTT
jgi:hypothetical protein